MAGKIFVNYRRDDVRDVAARMRDRLAQTFGGSNVFMDVDNLMAGQRFDRELEKALAATDIFLAVIGPRWLELYQQRQAAGERDYVHEEIAAALKRGITVIPVLVERAALPRADALPPDIRELVLHQKHEVTYEQFGRDTAALVDAIRFARKSGRPTMARNWSGSVGLLIVGLATAATAYAGAYYAGVPVPWPLATVQQGPSASELAAEKARAQAEERQRAAAAEIERERQARAKAEAENKRLAAVAEKAQRDLEARQKAEAEAKRKADEAEAKRKADETERLRLASLQKAEEDRQRAAAEAKRKEDEEAARRVPQPGQTFRDCNDGCPEMVVVPAGSFTMGSSDSEIAALTKEVPQGKKWWERERPQHKVTIRQPFAVGKYAVTRGEFAAFVSETGHKTDGGCYTWNGKEWSQQPDRSWRSPGFQQDDRHPVVCINWDDATAYVTWLSRKTGKNYRLVSEAEREYIARAGTATPFWWGSSITPRQANYNGNYTYGGGAKGEHRQRTVTVDSFEPNPWRLYNVHGNVWEWTEDCWNDSNTGNPGNGSARTSGDCSRRVVRGGSWDNIPQILRSAFRSGFSSVERDYLIGFRVGRTL